MAWDVNSVILVGRLVRDPEIRYSKSGNAFVNMSIAVGKKSSSDSSSSQSNSDVDYFDLVGFGKTAELCEKYLSKGKQVVIQGSLSQSRWKDQNDGKNRSKVNIVINQIQFLGSSSVKVGDNNSSNNSGSYNRSVVGAQKNKSFGSNIATDDFSDKKYITNDDSSLENNSDEASIDDIPF